MRIPVLKPIPTRNELVDLLNREFTGRFTSKLFGLNNSVMVRKSPWTGVQITEGNAAFDLQVTTPTIGMGYMLAILEMTGLAFAFVMPLRSEGQEMEREIADLLKKEYGTL